MIGGILAHLETGDGTYDNRPLWVLGFPRGRGQPPRSGSDRRADCSGVVVHDEGKVAQPDPRSRRRCACVCVFLREGPALSVGDIGLGASRFWRRFPQCRAQVLAIRNFNPGPSVPVFDRVSSGHQDHDCSSSCGISGTSRGSRASGRRRNGWLTTIIRCARSSHVLRSRRSSTIFWTKCSTCGRGGSGS